MHEHGVDGTRGVVIAVRRQGNSFMIVSVPESMADRAVYLTADWDGKVPIAKPEFEDGQLPFVRGPETEAETQAG